MFDVWKSALAELEQSIPSSSFNTWFKDTELISIEDNIATIGTPNPFKKSQLEKKYNEAIKHALLNSGAKFSTINYIISSNSGKQKTRKTPSDSRPESVKSVVKAPKQTLSKTSSFNNGLNPRYSLDNFVVGSNNDLAVSIAKNIIDNPGDRYNPFFLYGGPGLGKTHLVQAIGLELQKKNPKSKILYISTSDFYSEFIKCIRNNEGDNFSQKYRNLDVLIIDDFQMIAGKDRSQEEFFNIFNALHQSNKQIIITSDRLPSQIATIDERLASRLAWAGAIDLQLPNFEDRCAILGSMADYMGMNIEEEAIEYIAETVKTNIRDLEREFKYIMANSELKGITPLELINEGGYASIAGTTSSRAASPKQLVERVAKFYDLSVKEMCGKSRVAHIKNARQVTMYLLSEELNMSTPKIAQEVGVKDHTTVMHGIKKIKADLKLNFGLREQISQLREQLNG